LDMTARSVLLRAIEERERHNPPMNWIETERDGYFWRVKFKAETGKPVWIDKIEKAGTTTKGWGFGPEKIEELLR